MPSRFGAAVPVRSLEERVASEHDHEHIAEEERVVATVEPELHLVRVGGQMLPKTWW